MDTLPATTAVLTEAKIEFEVVVYIVHLLNHKKEVNDGLTIYNRTKIIYPY
jgi:hypothetical protein